MTSPLRFGDIVLVRFPFTDQTASKQRPAVIVSTEAYGLSRPDVILMAVTSRVRETIGYGEAFVADWREAGLLKPSVVKPVLATLAQTLIIKRLGILRSEDQAALRRTLAVLLG